MDKKQQAEQIINEITGKVSRPGSGRPGGNPDFGKKIGFKAEGDEPNNAKLSLWVKQSTLDKLKSLDNWRNVVRDELDKLANDL